jgi:hypothetical protein
MLNKDVDVYLLIGVGMHWAKPTPINIPIIE